VRSHNIDAFISAFEGAFEDIINDLDIDDLLGEAKHEFIRGHEEVYLVLGVGEEQA